MARSLWTGALSFGLVNVPVALYSGVKDTGVHFRQLHATDHVPIETRRYCSDEDVEVGYDETAHGYETDDAPCGPTGCSPRSWPTRAAPRSGAS
jgi:DNA end-binding protein Ku